MPVFSRHNTAALTILASIVVVGTILSIKNESFLDTSNPLISHLPHPHQSKSYFASKHTILNRVFVKYAWAWTSAVFWAIWMGADESEVKGGVKTLDQAGKWLGTTLVWGAFASWFFGPSLFNRIVALTGGECVVYMPAPQGAPQVPGIERTAPHLIAIPSEFCTGARTIVTPESHPALFAHPPLAEYLAQGMGFDPSYKIVPKLTKGHDISGHTFLLTLSTLFLVDALVKARKGKATPAALATQLAGWALVGLWATMLWATALYFHTWQEKASGFALGIVGFVFSQYPFEPSNTRPPVPKIVVNERPHKECVHPRPPLKSPFPWWKMADNRTPNASQSDAQLPDYALLWKIPGLQRLSGPLPAHFEDRVVPEALFYIPASANSPEQYITRHSCRYCRLKRKVWCDRAFPICTMCAKLGEKCVPLEAGWMPLPHKLGPGSRTGRKDLYPGATRKEKVDAARPRPSYRGLLRTEQPTDDAPEPPVKGKKTSRSLRSRPSTVQQEDQSDSATATGSTVPRISSSDPSPKPEASSSLVPPKSSPLPIISAEAPALEASENGGPSATGAEHDTTPTPNNPPQDEPFRWKPLITPWTSMYRSYESRSLLESIPSGSGNNPKMEVEEKTSQTVAWSDTLEELQEAIPFIKSLEPGYQLSSVGLLEALVLAGPAQPGDKCVDDVLWVSLTFRSELKKPKTPQTKEPTVADYPIDPIIEALYMNHHWGVPFALIADEKFGVLPFSLEAPFTVLGWYHVCGVGEPTHTLDSTAKRPIVHSAWTFRFRPTSEAAGPSNIAAEDSSPDSPMDQEHTLRSALFHDQQTEDIVMGAASTSEMSLGPQGHLAVSAPVPRRGRSAEDPLASSVSAMNIGEQIRARSSSTAVAMEVDPPYEALQAPDNASAVSHGGGHRGAAPGTDPHEQPDPSNASLGFGGYKKPYALPSQAEMYAEYANTMIRINEWGKESSASSVPGPKNQASLTTTAAASQSTPNQSPTRARATHDPYGDAACVDPPSSATLSPSSTRLPSAAEMFVEYANTMARINGWDNGSSTSTPSSTRNPTSPSQPPSSSSTRNHHPSQVPERPEPQNAQKGGIKARLMASVLEWTALRKPTREGFTLKSSVAETPGSEPAPMEESPPQPPQTAEGQNSLSESSDLDGIPLEEPSPPRSPPSPPSPLPGAEEPVTRAIVSLAPETSVSTVNATPSKESQTKAAASSRKGKARSKHERPTFGPPKPQDLPQFPNLGPPPTADAPISPEELGLSFDRQELDPNSTTQWDIIATKLDGFVCTRCRKANARRFWSYLLCNYCQHRTELPRPKWAWHTLTLGDPAVMPEYGRDDGDYYKGFTMGRVLWNDGVEAITYVGEADDRLKIIHVKTTKSPLRDPLENVIAESADLKSLVRPRFAQGKGAGNLAPYFAHIVGEGDLEIHPELKPTPFEEIYDKDCILEKIDTFMGQCAAHTCLSPDTGPFDQQVLLLGGADAPAITEAFCKDNMIAFTVVGATCDLTVKSVNSWKTEKGRKEHDFFAHIDMLHGDFVCVMASTALKYSLERKGFGLVTLGRWIQAKPDEGD